MKVRRRGMPRLYRSLYLPEKVSHHCASPAESGRNRASKTKMAALLGSHFLQSICLSVAVQQHAFVLLFTNRAIEQLVAFEKDFDECRACVDRALDHRL